MFDNAWSIKNLYQNEYKTKNITNIVKNENKVLLDGLFMLEA